MSDYGLSFAMSIVAPKLLAMLDRLEVLQTEYNLSDEDIESILESNTAEEINPPSF